ncbi:hypothetical protein VTK56DRAFT_8604 [Thermocarpiscus australiensis]
MLCYQHAAEAARPAPVPEGSDPSSSGSGGRGSSSSGESSVWSGSALLAAHTAGTGGGGGGGGGGPGVGTGAGKDAPTSMTIGTFDVDDLDVQMALQMQLLLGEMRRAGRLIDQFASGREEWPGLGHGGQPGQSVHAASAPGGLEGLYPSLGQWLRGEHSEITNGMRSKLRELNAQLR